MMMRVLAILLFVAYALSFPNFPGDCQTITTDTTGRHNVNGVTSGAGTFTITGPTSYTPGGGAVSVTLNGGTTFTGFLLWAQDANGVRQGVWTAGGNSQTGANFAANTVNAAVCNNAQGNPAGTLGQNSNGAKTTVTAQWTPPATAVGSLTFQAYVVQNLNNAFNNINLAVPVAAAVTPTSAAAAATTKTSAAVATSAAKTSATSAAAAATSKTSAAAGTPTSAAVTPTSAAGTPTSAAGTPTSAPVSAGVNNLGSGNGGAGAGGNGLSTGAMAGIAVGVAIGGVLLLAMVVPIIYARVKKDDPRVQRMTQRFTRSFQRA